MMSRMNSLMRHVLLIDFETETLEFLTPMFRRNQLDIHTVEASPFVLDLIRGTPFEILIVKFPPKGISMEDMITAARELGSMCRNSGLVVMTDAEYLAEAIPWMDRGVNRIIMLEWSRERIWETIDELLDVAPRLDIDVPVQVALPDHIARDIVLFRTANISTTGALLSGIRSVPEGTRFTFQMTLPGAEPISGGGLVVRRADSGYNGLFGFGIRYINLDDKKREVLDRFIAERLRRRMGG